MAEFVCNRCGKCCLSLGQHIMIERQLNDHDYFCRSSIDHAIFPVHVDPEYRDEIAGEFSDREVSGETGTCIFLRKRKGGGGTACAVHATRPAICREFRCCRMVIRDRDGNVRGSVVGKATLRTGDESLQKIWKEKITPIPRGDDTCWAGSVTRILAGYGYDAEFLS